MVCPYGQILDLSQCVCCKRFNGRYVCKKERDPTNPVEMIEITDPMTDPDAGRKRSPKLASNEVEMIAITDPNNDEDAYKPRRPKKLA